MSEVQWVKITTDMFENRKIRYIRKLPDGNNIVLIWVMLLTLAGKCNSGGMIFLTENVPYTPKMLADELDFEENTVILALQALESLGMIQTEGFLQITGWAEHQNVDGMEKIREQTRRRVARFREKQKELPPAEGDVTLRNATSYASVTQCNAPRIDKNRIDKNREEKEKNKRKEPDAKQGEVASQCDGDVTDGDAPATKSIEKGNKDPKMVIGLSFTGSLQDAMLEWLAYKKEEHRYTYKERGLKSLITQVKNAVAKYGEAAVIDTIQTSMANGYQGIIFDSLKKGTTGKGSPDKGRVATCDYSNSTEDDFPF